MFLNHFSLDKQVGFLRVADYVAVADGRLIESEKDILLQYADEMKLEATAREQGYELENPEGQAEGRESRGERLAELLVELGALERDDASKEEITGVGAMVQVGGFFGSKGSEGYKEAKGVGEWTFSLSQALRKFEDDFSQKILILEVLAIVFANDEYHVKQKEAMQYILDFFDLTPELVTVYSEWAKTMVSLQRQGNALLHLS